MTPHITASQVAQHLSISPGTVRRLTRDGTIPALRIGRIYRYDLNEVRSALETDATPAAPVLARSQLRALPQRERERAVYDALFAA